MEGIYRTRLFLGVDAFDPQMHLKPVAVLSKMQELGTGQCETLGLGESWLEQQGAFWVMVRMCMHLGEGSGVGFSLGETWHQGVWGALWRRDYRLQTLAGVDYANVVALWALLDRSNRNILRPHRFPSEFPSVPEALALPHTPRKLSCSGKMPLLTEYVISYRDLDNNGHAHNGRYAEWICDALPRNLWDRHSVRSMQIDFRKEALEGDTIAVFGEPLQNDSGVWHIAAYIKEELCFCAELKLSNFATY